MVPMDINRSLPNIYASRSIYGTIYPQQYVAYRATPSPDNVKSKTQAVSADSVSTPSPAVTIDGDLDKPFWNDVPWTEDFVDIATDTKPKFRTRVKMRWDDEFFYVGAMMEETDVWGTLTEHNSVIFHDNDFEVFVDTDGSNHNYKEFEINALGTTWSLLLNKPYGDGGGECSKRLDPSEGYDMEPPLQSAVKVYPGNAINAPDTQNTHWTAEIALPISKLIEKNPFAKKPADGVFWRVNFSRVQWGFKVNSDGKYEKDPCCQSCAVPGTSAEDNWVWSKQGEVAMHLPERWGIVQFSTDTPPNDAVGDTSKLSFYEEWPSRCAAMALYYALKGYHEKEKRYTGDIEKLKEHAIQYFPICNDAQMSVETDGETFVAKATLSSFTAAVDQDRYLVVSNELSVSE